MKAKDLRGKNIEDIDNSASEEQEDAVAAAYENISKKLESIRGGRDEDESSESEEKEEVREEVELEEWKGPRKPSEEELRPQEIEDEDEDQELRKVKLGSSEEELKKEDEEEEEIDPLDDEDDEDEGQESRVKGQEEDEEKSWEPEENDPLDDDEEPEDKDQESRIKRQDIEEEETAVEEEEEKEPVRKYNADAQSGFERSEKFEAEKSFDENQEDDLTMPSKREPQPDTLDDLAREARHSRPMAGGSAEDEEYYIPSLKGSRQEGGDLGYNAHPQRGGIGESYSPRGNNMENNDPNNFFSQHSQPQAPKRANKFHLLILVLIGIGVIGFTVYILKGGFGELNIGNAQPSPSPSAAPTVEPTPTPTPEPEVEREEFTIKVLNGTTTSGLAGKVRDKMKELGYGTATPGNNSDTDVEQTEVRVKEGTQSAALLQRLIADLAPDYEAVEGDTLDSKAAYDAEVIIGAK